MFLAHIDFFSPSLSPSLPLSLKLNKRGLKKKKETVVFCFLFLICINVSYGLAIGLQPLGLWNQALNPALFTAKSKANHQPNSPLTVHKEPRVTGSCLP